ncbi:acyltransferase [Piscinibacter sp. HJYY11]|uniref:acyltransferase family protein n=1 Tax=Piscinibacter sp. HJYY11 TaxID=2801333 RepID=UPI00191F55EF|nr:acyltransferase [Piscinibacter sp. HJYY11]MBL0728744.1 acyltransferase [Piscinibacter sp. HJYY11]
MNAHAAFRAQQYFGSLDGLRAISILAVLWHHTQPDTVDVQFRYLGMQGVTLFFAISAFLITTLLLRERERDGTVDVRAFYLRRVLRIFPLYYAVVLVYVLVVYLLERDTPAGEAFFDNLPAFLTFTSNLFVENDGRVIFYFAWSLAAEEQFYLVWPLLLGLAASASRAFRWLSVLLLALIGAEFWDFKPEKVVPVAIVAGSWVAVALHQERSYTVMRAVFGHPAALVAVLAGLALCLPSFLVPNFVVHLLFAALVACCVVREDHWAAPALRRQPMVFIGTISYGMYLLHMLARSAVIAALKALDLPTDGLHVFAGTLVLTIVLAWLSFRYFESAFLKLKSRIPTRTGVAPNTVATDNP